LTVLSSSPVCRKPSLCILCFVSLGTCPAFYLPAYLVPVHLSPILIQLLLCLLSQKLFPSINPCVLAHLYYQAAAYASCAHYLSFICICTIHAICYLLAITSPAGSLMSPSLPLGVNSVRTAFPIPREQRDQTDIERSEGGG
jgi:hypothetical protein